jgi:hypothetical protein
MIYSPAVAGQPRNVLPQFDFANFFQLIKRARVVRSAGHHKY